MTKVIPFSEVRKHKSRKNLWMVIHNDIYDVSAFLAEHPGGEDTLLEAAGTDATQSFEDVGHSADARQLLKKYKIGTLSEAERTNMACNICVQSKKKQSCALQTKGPSKEKSWRTYDGAKSSSSNLKWYLLAALAGAVLIGVILKKKMS